MRRASEPSFSWSDEDDCDAPDEKAWHTDDMDQERVGLELHGCATLNGVAGRNRTGRWVIWNMLIVAVGGRALIIRHYGCSALSASFLLPTTTRL